MTYVPRPLSPERAHLRAKISANARWAKEPDRAAAMAHVRDGLTAKFESEVDPEGLLSPVERAKRVKNARSAYYQRLYLASLKAREAKKVTS